MDIVARTDGRRGNRFIFIPPFSSPIKECVLYVDDRRMEGMTSAEGTNIKALLTFESNTGELEVRTALSSVDTQGAAKNLWAETKIKHLMPSAKRPPASGTMC